MDRIRFITHRRKRILLVDLTNCSANEVIKLMGEMQRIVTAQPRESALTLGDLTGAVQPGRDHPHEGSRRIRPTGPFVKRAALVGAESLPKVFYEAVKTFSRREFPRFKTREEALDWLVKEAA